jgi:hypothetical protein
MNGCLALLVCTNTAVPQDCGTSRNTRRWQAYGDKLAIVRVLYMGGTTSLGTRRWHIYGGINWQLPASLFLSSDAKTFGRVSMAATCYGVCIWPTSVYTSSIIGDREDNRTS